MRCWNSYRCAGRLLQHLHQQQAVVGTAVCRPHTSSQYLQHLHAGFVRVAISPKQWRG